MIDFEKLFQGEQSNFNRQKKLQIESGVGVYFGYSSDGLLRLSFLSKGEAPSLVSTKNLIVTQGEETPGVYWTCFDLLNNDTKAVFYTFCGNMAESVVGITNETKALASMKKRYLSWKAMFKNISSATVPREVLQGLYGELYFLKNRMINQYGLTVAINAWSGPDSKSKDFSVGKEWYEIKTVGANMSEVRISSLAQLSSTYKGHLVVIKVETMSQEFQNGEACIKDLFTDILLQIKDETLENVFLGKLGSFGIDLSDTSLTEKFCVKAVFQYLVDDSFPRITEDNILRKEICEVKYSLNINALEKYREE